MAICDCGCAAELDTPGRGTARRFYSPTHRARFHTAARRIGGQMLRRRKGRKMIDLASMTPAERRLELGKAALRMGVIG